MENENNEKEGEGEGEEERRQVCCRGSIRSVGNEGNLTSATESHSWRHFVRRWKRRE